MLHTLSGTPSDQLPLVLAVGVTDVGLIFTSMAAREPGGDDAGYLRWHSLDHRPEQYRLAGLRHSLRLVSTPACRAARAFENADTSAVDHVMTYYFASDAALEPFGALSIALGGNRRPYRLPSVAANYFRLVGKIAAPSAIAGADVMPWRPSLGVYLLVEQGMSSPVPLCDVAGVAGIWWHAGGVAPIAGFPDATGIQMTYCFLDDDPVGVAERLREPLERRWQSGIVVPLLAAPFYTLVPFDWSRHLP